MPCPFFRPKIAGAMKKQTKATRRNVSVLAQLVQWIPQRAISSLASRQQIKARELSYDSQIYELMLGQIAHALSLNEICDMSEIHRAELHRVRRTTPAKRNTFSNANRTRDPEVVRKLYWATREHLEKYAPSFFAPRNRGKLARFRERRINAIDSTTLQLSMDSMDWAKHRRRKAAAKLHMRMDTASMLPMFMVVDSASHHDSTKARLLCESVSRGDIVVADRGYNDFSFFAYLREIDAFFVVREKDGLLHETVESMACEGDILCDEKIRLTGVRTSRAYPHVLRRVKASVEVDGARRTMVFLTNNMQWAPLTIAELYRSRWAVELLFKELKQTLQLRGFYGENRNAVTWQIWAALLVHMILRFVRHLSSWSGSYTRFAAMVKCAIWMKVDLLELFRFYGTAPPVENKDENPEAPCLPGFESFFRHAMG